MPDIDDSSPSSVFASPDTWTVDGIIKKEKIEEVADEYDDPHPTLFDSPSTWAVDGIIKKEEIVREDSPPLSSKLEDSDFVEQTAEPFSDELKENIIDDSVFISIEKNEADFDVDVEKSTSNDFEGQNRSEIISNYVYRAYNCGLCPFESVNEFITNQHFKDTHSKCEFFCNQCGFAARLKESIMRHVNTAHIKKTYRKGGLQQSSETNTNTNLNVCLVRGKRAAVKKADVSGPGYSKIMNNSVCRKYKCRLCAYESVFETDCTEHVTKAHSRKIYFCEHCGYETYYKAFLARHLNLAHLNQVDPKFSVKTRYEVATKTDLARKEIAQKIRPIRFKLLNISSQSQKLKKSRFSTDSHSNIFRITDRRGMGSTPSLNSKYKNSLKIHKCKLCKFRAIKKVSVDLHVKSVHLKMMNFECNRCEYRASCISDLNQHIYAIHLKFDHFECDYCDFTTYTKTILTKHKNAHHKHVDNFTCDQCSFETNFKVALINHIKIHLPGFSKKSKKRKYSKRSVPPITVQSVHTRETRSTTRSRLKGGLGEP